MIRRYVKSNGFIVISDPFITNGGSAGFPGFEGYAEHAETVKRLTSCGADTRELVELDPTSAGHYITSLHLACAAIRKTPVPVIARIDGCCLGAGLEIAISCDLRVASATSTFGMPEVKVGLPSVIEAVVLRRLIGPGKTRQLVYTGESIAADEALACGLVEKVVQPEELNTSVDEWARAIADAGPRAIRLQKELVRRWDDVPLDHAIVAGIHSFTTAYTTDEPRRLIRRFLDRKAG